MNLVFSALLQEAWLVNSRTTEQAYSPVVLFPFCAIVKS